MNCNNQKYKKTHRLFLTENINNISEIKLLNKEIGKFTKQCDEYLIINFSYDLKDKINQENVLYWRDVVSLDTEISLYHEAIQIRDKILKLCGHSLSKYLSPFAYEIAYQAFKLLCVSHLYEQNNNIFLIEDILSDKKKENYEYIFLNIRYFYKYIKYKIPKRNLDNIQVNLPNLIYNKPTLLIAVDGDNQLSTCIEILKEIHKKHIQCIVITSSLNCINTLKKLKLNSQEYVFVQDVASNYQGNQIISELALIKIKLLLAKANNTNIANTIDKIIFFIPQYITQVNLLHSILLKVENQVKITNFLSINNISMDSFVEHGAEKDQ